jgi:hypothetical protein
MNRLTLISALSCLVLFTTCKKDEGLIEEQKTSFIKMYGSVSEGRDMVQTNDGGFIMVGSTSPGGDKDVLLVKTDEYGNQIWNKKFAVSAENDDIGNSIAITQNGDYAIYGTAVVNDTSDLGSVTPVTKGLFFITSSLGIPVSSFIFYGDTGIVLKERGNSIAVASNGNIILAGSITNPTPEPDEVYAVSRLVSATDYKTLGFLTVETFDISNVRENYVFNSVIQSSTGSYVFAGTTNHADVTGQDGENMFVVEFVAFDTSAVSGNGETRTVGGSGDDAAHNIIENSSGNFVVGGFVTDTLGSKDVAIFETNKPTSAVPLWFTSFGESNSSSDVCYGVFGVSDGYIIAGSTEISGQQSQLYMAKTDLSGNKLWTRSYGFIEFDEARAVIETSDGGYALFGTATDERGNSAMCMIKTNSSGDLK